MAVEPTVAEKPSEKIEEIVNHLESIKHSLSELPPMPSDAMSYTELKMQLMINYVANLAYYVSLKHKGESVANHPVFKHLAFLRTFMERLAPLDVALKYQIEKLLLETSTESDDENGGGESTTGPDLRAFMPSVSSAVKSISVDQVKKTVTDFATGGKMEIDPMLIAAQIQRAQQKSQSVKKKRTVKTYVEQDSEDERIGSEDDFVEEVKVSKKKKKKTAAAKSSKPQFDHDDEEIDSDEFDD
jgi:hypothetical protein